MYQIELANNSRHQNIEIIYNNKNVYYKTTRIIRRDDTLAAFPSKDLEISLGLQYIAINADEKYACKKCAQCFEYEHHLMLHARYFCSYNINSLLKTLSSLRPVTEISPPPPYAPPPPAPAQNLAQNYSSLLDTLKHMPQMWPNTSDSFNQLQAWVMPKMN